MNILICPFCGAPLEREGASYYCKGALKRHCFDAAKSGYVSLTRASGTSGDDREMVRARTAFLDKGYYAPFADAIAKAASGADVIIDAGCGEGYYSNRLAESAQVLGFDLSKHACDKAAKRAKAAGNGAFFGVSSVFELPIADASADAVVSLFAPIAEKEFARVLKPGGKLIVGAAGRRHLIELKEAVYAEAYENEGRRDLPEGFALTGEQTVTFRFDCAGEDLRPLFSMTPYAFKTSVSDAAKLDALTHLEITAEFDIFVYTKR